jgi:hypothetical protein
MEGRSSGRGAGLAGGRSRGGGRPPAAVAAWPVCLQRPNIVIARLDRAIQ